MSKKKLAGFIAGVLGISAIVGSWAYFSEVSSIDNELSTGEYSARTIEEFTPSEKWQPGQEITKTVAATNTGDYSLVVRVKFDETWSTTTDGTTTTLISSSSVNEDGTKNAGFFATTHVAGSTLWDASAAQKVFDTTINDGTKDGFVKDNTNSDDSVVYKELTGLTGDWVDGGDGYFYYKMPLAAGETTDDLLSSIVLASNADMGVYSKDTFYSTVDKSTITADSTDEDYEWSTEKPEDVSTITYQKGEASLIPGQTGYAGADYKLTVVTEVCQATKDAVDATWTVPSAVLTAWNLE